MSWMSWRDHYTFKKRFSIKLIRWTRNRQCWQLCDFFSAGSWSFVGQLPKLLVKLLNFAETSFFFEMFLWKYKMQLWRTRKKLLDKKLTLFSSKSKYDEKTICLSKNFLFLHWSHRHVNCGFDSPIEVFLVEGQKFFTQCPKKMKKIYFFEGKYFLREIPTEIKKTVWIKPPNFFGKKLIFFRSK